jgi:glyceraldehyde-3-phosphate dehydrogenase/erythrose-4-phosphate dehydrogenase
MEGFEHYVESIFGTKGPLSSAAVKQGLEKLRVLRSAPEGLKSKVDALPNVVDTNFNNPKVSSKIVIDISCETNCLYFSLFMLCLLHIFMLCLNGQILFVTL